MQVEVEKEGIKRGKYLNPEEHGMPEVMGEHYEERKKIEEEYQRMMEENKRIKEEDQKIKELHEAVNNKNLR